jgi:phosphoribosylformylglycinamidine (FGAM) synthase-like enzyme
VSEKSMTQRQAGLVRRAKMSRRNPARRETGHFRNYWEHCGIKSAKALHRKAVRAIERAAIGKSKRKFPFSTAAQRSAESGDYK